MLDWFLSTGPLGLAACVVGLLILVAGAALGFGARMRHGAWIFLLVSLVPLAIGGLGTVAGMHNAQQVIESSPGNASPREMEHARSQALRSTWLGAGVSALLVLLALGAAAANSEGNDAEKEPAR